MAASGENRGGDMLVTVQESGGTGAQRVWSEGGASPEARARAAGTRRLAVAHLGPAAQSPGGMPAVLRGLLGSPLADRHDLVAIATHRPGGLRTRSSIFAHALVALVRWSLRAPPGPAHVHVTVRGSMYRKTLVAVLAVALRCPFILHVHAGAIELEAFHARLGPARRTALRWAFRAAARVLAVSRASAQVLERHYGAPAVRILPNLVEQVPRVPASPPDPHRPPRILFLGGFANPVKGGLVLVEALPALWAACPGRGSTWPVPASRLGLWPPRRTRCAGWAGSTCPPSGLRWPAPTCSSCPRPRRACPSPCWRPWPPARASWPLAWEGCRRSWSTVARASSYRRRPGRARARAQRARGRPRAGALPGRECARARRRARSRAHRRAPRRALPRGHGARWVTLIGRLATKCLPDAVLLCYEHPYGDLWRPLLPSCSSASARDLWLWATEDPCSSAPPVGICCSCGR
jgi:hypothetical protein